MKIYMNLGDLLGLGFVALICIATLCAFLISKASELWQRFTNWIAFRNSK